jgi:hypothetical protein
MDLIHATSEYRVRLPTATQSMENFGTCVSSPRWELTLKILVAT